MRQIAMTDGGGRAQQRDRASNRVPWWEWALVAAPWAAGLVWAAVVVARGGAEREVVVGLPVTVVAILAGAIVTAVAATAVIWAQRRPAEAPDGSQANGARRPGGPAVEPQPPALPPDLQRRLDDEVARRLRALRELLAEAHDAATLAGSSHADRNLLAAAHATVEELSTIFAELRTLIDMADRQPEPEPVDVVAVLDEVAALVTASPGLHGRRLRGSDGTEAGVRHAVAALGVRDLLFLALHKIVLNALTFSRPEDTITLHVSSRDGQVAIDVSDTGVGIPADEMPDVWEPFTRGRSAAGTTGVGLGLALARAAVERQGGTVRARSREGLGTVVTVLLPTARGGR